MLEVGGGGREPGKGSVSAVDAPTPPLSPRSLVTTPTRSGSLTPHPFCRETNTSRAGHSRRGAACGLSPAIIQGPLALGSSISGPVFSQRELNRKTVLALREASLGVSTVLWAFQKGRGKMTEFSPSLASMSRAVLHIQESSPEQCCGEFCGETPFLGETPALKAGRRRTWDHESPEGLGGELEPSGLLSSAFHCERRDRVLQRGQATWRLGSHPLPPPRLPSSVRWTEASGGRVAFSDSHEGILRANGGLDLKREIGF